MEVTPGANKLVEDSISNSAVDDGAEVTPPRQLKPTEPPSPKAPPPAGKDSASPVCVVSPGAKRTPSSAKSSWRELVMQRLRRVFKPGRSTSAPSGVKKGRQSVTPSGRRKSRIGIRQCRSSARSSSSKAAPSAAKDPKAEAVADEGRSLLDTAPQQGLAGLRVAAADRIRAAFLRYMASGRSPNAAAAEAIRDSAKTPTPQKPVSMPPPPASWGAMASGSTQGDDSQGEGQEPTPSPPPADIDLSESAGLEGLGDTTRQKGKKEKKAAKAEAKPKGAKGKRSSKAVEETAEAEDAPADKAAKKQEKAPKSVRIPIEALSQSQETDASQGGGKARPSRARVRPLEHWRNEQAVYERPKGSLAPKVVAVEVKPAQEEKSKSKTRAKAKSSPKGKTAAEKAADAKASAKKAKAAKKALKTTQDEAADEEDVEDIPAEPKARGKAKAKGKAKETAQSKAKAKPKEKKQRQLEQAVEDEEEMQEKESALPEEFGKAEEEELLPFPPSMARRSSPAVVVPRASLSLSAPQPSLVPSIALPRAARKSNTGEASMPAMPFVPGLWKPTPSNRRIPEPPLSAASGSSKISPLAAAAAAGSRKKAAAKEQTGSSGLSWSDLPKPSTFSSGLEQRLEQRRQLREGIPPAETVNLGSAPIPEAPTNSAPSRRGRNSTNRSTSKTSAEVRSTSAPSSQRREVQERAPVVPAGKRGQTLQAELPPSPAPRKVAKASPVSAAKQPAPAAAKPFGLMAALEAARMRSQPRPLSAVSREKVSSMPVAAATAAKKTPAAKPSKPMSRPSLQSAAERAAAAVGNFAQPAQKAPARNKRPSPY
eukprot:TRINITY_DN11491_c0_g2_i1.p1 TRINITY_DN11491_c0_g2~~TRINITY_DN11491_c0_g2_i1.p1  ORF type:complete len:824 (+),score=255.15 TRINITY_DN11491_c0_g2_i1:124-2595(+)